MGTFNGKRVAIKILIHIPIDSKRVHVCVDLRMKTPTVDQLNCGETFTH